MGRAALIEEADEQNQRGKLQEGGKTFRGNANNEKRRQNDRQRIAPNRMHQTSHASRCLSVTRERSWNFAQLGSGFGFRSFDNLPRLTLWPPPNGKTRAGNSYLSLGRSGFSDDGSVNWRPAMSEPVVLRRLRQASAWPRHQARACLWSRAPAWPRRDHQAVSEPRR